MAITGVGALRGLKNIMAMQAAKEEKNRWEAERKDKREALIMQLWSKHGSSGLNRLFPGEDAKSAIQIASLNTARPYQAPGVVSDTDDIEQTQLDPVINPDKYAMSTGELSALDSLKNNYNLDDNTIATFKAVGDPDVWQQLHKKIIDVDKKFSSEGREMPTDYLQQVVEKSVLTHASPTKGLNMKKIEDYIGREMDVMFKAMLEDQPPARGDILLGDVFYAERPSIEDLGKFDKEALKGSLSRAQAERLKVIEEQAKLSETTGNQDLKNWLANRLVTINNALEQYQKENIFPLASLYGTESVGKLLENYGEFKSVKQSLNPALFTEEIKNEVPNRNAAQILLDLGLLKVGDVVRNLETGKLIEIQ